MIFRISYTFIFCFLISIKSNAQNENGDTVNLFINELVKVNNLGQEFYCVPIIESDDFRVQYYKLDVKTSSLYYLVATSKNDSSIITGFYLEEIDSSSSTKCWHKVFKWEKIDKNKNVLWENFYDNGLAIKSKKIVVVIKE
jgi:hypothetical protein